MLQGKLDNDLISQSELWRLVLMLDEGALHVALYPPVAREEIIWRTFPLDSAAPDRLRALEDIIYDNPLLLNDFRRVDCIIDSPNHVLVPELTEPELFPLLMSATGTAEDPEETVAFPVAENALLLQELEPDTTAFLRRTFFNIQFHARTPVLARYLISHSGGLKPSRAIVLMGDNRLTFMAIRDNRLLAANNFKFRSRTDAAYYVLSAMNSVGFDPADQNVDLAIHGESLTADDTLAGTLRPYVRNIRAVPFPTLRYRVSRSTLLIPFPLLVLPICE